MLPDSQKKSSNAVPVQQFAVVYYCQSIIIVGRCLNLPTILLLCNKANIMVFLLACIVDEWMKTKQKANSWSRAFMLAYVGWLGSESGNRDAFPDDT